MSDRQAELAANLADFRVRLEAACAAAGRDAAEITLVAVTKTFPADDVARLAAIGVTDVGENRDQEAAAKHETCADLPLRWHFVGALQRNKARSVARYADVVHSIDRPRLVTALSEAARGAGRDLLALVQVSLDAAPGRSGAPPDHVPALAAAIEAADGLTLGGVMAVAPLGADPDPAFARLAEIALAMRADHPEATMVSAGMSGDFEAALRHGATHLRIGTALLGRRSGVVG
ncbi:MAG: YggS family pyridoxal phosphate-dependent enzyme [Frankiaceae bacterium]|nr:YggS family pyridoxal phosphate-dependent enzyme [Frankiaceae bacterium]MBV9870015.1 YggS family pyridoxal phosphate-dependent enzyme [Frankiaceae bacterium]